MCTLKRENRKYIVKHDNVKYILPELRLALDLIFIINEEDKNNVQ